jgi:hypothetical protein
VLYGYALAYLVAPSTFSSANVVEVVAGMPDAVKVVGKTLLAIPFAFHSLNGLRHLSWDMGYCTSYAPSFRPLLTGMIRSPFAQGRVPVRLRSPRCHRVVDRRAHLHVEQHVIVYPTIVSSSVNPVLLIVFVLCRTRSVSMVECSTLRLSTRLARHIQRT